MKFGNFDQEYEIRSKYITLHLHYIVCDFKMLRLTLK